MLNKPEWRELIEAGQGEKMAYPVAQKSSVPANGRERLRTNFGVLETRLRGALVWTGNRGAAHSLEELKGIVEDIFQGVKTAVSEARGDGLHPAFNKEEIRELGRIEALIWKELELIRRNWDSNAEAHANDIKIQEKRVFLGKAFDDLKRVLKGDYSCVSIEGGNAPLPPLRELLRQADEALANSGPMHPQSNNIFH